MSDRHLDPADLPQVPHSVGAHELNGRLTRMENDIQTIKDAIVGNLATGAAGMSPRLSAVEAWQKAMEARLAAVEVALAQKTEKAHDRFWTVFLSITGGLMVAMTTTAVSHVLFKSEASR